MDIVQSILPPQNRLTGSNEVDGQNRFATTHNQMSQWQSHAIFHSWRVGNAIFARFTLKCVLIGLNLERDKKHKRKKKQICVVDGFTPCFVVYFSPHRM